MRRAGLGLGIWMLTACGAPTPPVERLGDSADAHCPLGDDERVVVLALARSAVLDGAFAATESDDLHTAFAWHLPGVDTGVGARARLAEQCTGPIVHAPYCDGRSDSEDDPFILDHNRCFQLACEEAGVNLAESWQTMHPHTERADRHEFVVETDLVPGVATWTQNPVQRFRLDVRDVNHIVAAAEGGVELFIESTVGHSFDSSYVSTAHAELHIDDLGESALSASAHIEMPRIAEHPVVVDIAIDEAAIVSGGIVVGDVEVAAFDGHFDGHGIFPVTFISDCE